MRRERLTSGVKGRRQQARVADRHAGQRPRTVALRPIRSVSSSKSAHEFDVKDVVTDPDDGSNPTDDELRAEAARAHSKRTASYLLGTPLLADHLEEALAQFGQSCAD
jgi:hypothetical protein